MSPWSQWPWVLTFRGPTFKAFGAGLLLHEPGDRRFARVLRAINRKVISRTGFSVDCLYQTRWLVTLAVEPEVARRTQSEQAWHVAVFGAAGKEVGIAEVQELAKSKPVSVDCGAANSVSTLSPSSCDERTGLVEPDQIDAISVRQLTRPSNDA